MLPRVADPIEKVRKHALRGLGNLVTVWGDDVVESAASVMSSLTSASEDTVRTALCFVVPSVLRLMI